MHTVQEQETTSAKVLIESESGRFGCICVQDMTCEDRLALLERAHVGGWALITRGVHWFDKTDQEGAVTGEEPSEYWYFENTLPARKRAALPPSGPSLTGS